MFDDGSGSQDYMNNSDCKWIIQPSNATDISLYFSSMDLSGADFVKIYDGTSVMDPLLASFDGTASNPPPNTITSSGGNMLIHFNSNSSYSDPGWTAHFSSTSAPISYCSGTQTLTSSSDNLEDGSSSYSYLSNTQCQWLILPGSNKIINLSFSAFETESGYDYLDIYDGTNSNAPLLGSFSGNTIPPTIISSSGAMFLDFSSDVMTEYDGWSASYYTSNQTQYCNGLTTLTNTTGSINDGSNTNDNYSSNTNCQWLIQPNGAATIELSFNQFKTEAYYDELKVYDGSSNGANLIGTYSGTNLPNTIVSSGPSLYLTFTSDTYINEKGWSLSYTSNYAAYCNDTTSLLAALGTFDDGSGNNNYSNNSDCYWLIQPAGASSIQIDFNYFNTESGQDMLYIYDGNNTSSNLLQTLSGNSSPSSILSTSGEVMLHFNSNNSNSDIGWEIDYTANYGGSPYCSGTTNLTTSSGTFSDGSGNSDYIENSDCKWLIQPAGANIINLSFSQFNTEQNNDYINVYDGFNFSAPLIGSFSGTNIPNNITSSGGAMLVHFVTDGNNNSAGWEASYNTNTGYCSDTVILSNGQGLTDDGSGVYLYANNSNCYWLIEPSGAAFIDLEFDYIEIEQNNDHIKIYDGPSSSSPLLGSFTGSLNNVKLQSSGPEIFIHFTSNSTNPSDGWEFEYEAYYVPIDYCEDTFRFNAPTDTFNDGSNQWNYNNNISCYWLIECDDGNEIAIDFNYFNTEKNRDLLHIYDGANTNADLIATISGQSIPYTITSNSNALLLHFETDEANREDGWEISYTIGDYMGLDEIDQIKIIDRVKYCKFIQNNINEKWQLKIFSMNGMLIKESIISEEEYTLNKEPLNRGVYLIQLINNKGTIRSFRMCVL